MRTIQKALFAALLILTIFTTATLAAAQDPLAVEIQRWQEFVRANPATDNNWKSIRGTAEPVLDKADRATKDGNKLYALHLLASVRTMLAAQKYLAERPEGSRAQLQALEQEWKSVGRKLQPVLNGEDRPTFERAIAFNRAVAEASFSEVKVYYEASIEYGRNTVPDAGLYYLGAAQAQLDLANYSSNLRMDMQAGKLRIPGLASEIDAFEDHLLAVYKPPASVEHHPVFIRASAMLKQARELQSVDLHYGAFYRYLEARLRLSRINPPEKPLTDDDVVRRTAELQAKLDAHEGDHSIARMFLEMALAEASDSSDEKQGGQTARVIFDDVLPHYFAALQPPKKTAQQPPAEVTVTLVRWPYT